MSPSGKSGRDRATREYQAWAYNHDGQRGIILLRRWRPYDSNANNSKTEMGVRELYGSTKKNSKAEVGARTKYASSVISLHFRTDNQRTLQVRREPPHKCIASPPKLKLSAKGLARHSVRPISNQCIFATTAYIHVYECEQRQFYFLETHIILQYAINQD